MMDLILPTGLAFSLLFIGAGPAPLVWHLRASTARTFYGSDSSPYLTRFTLLRMGRAGRILLQQFHRADGDQEMHDHPWDFVSVVLRGWYVEEIGGCARKVPRKPFSIAYRQAVVPHRIGEISPGGCWTLLWVGPETGRDWGFYTSQGWRPWREFLRLPLPDHTT